MFEIGVQQAERLAMLLAGELPGCADHPAGDSALEAFREMSLLALALQRETGPLRLDLVDGVLGLGKHRFGAPPACLVELGRLFEQKGICGVILKPGVSARDLRGLARRLGEPASGADELARGLSADGIGSIEIRKDDPLTRGYNRAICAIREIFRRIDHDEVPDIRPLSEVAQGLAQAALRDPAALLGLTMSKDYDSYSFHHSVNVGVLAMALSATMGHPLSTVEEAGIAGFLHDVGKTKVDKGIVTKPGKLTDQEYDEMKRHPEYGALLICQMEGMHARVAEGVLGHHIRFDREGYPEWARELHFGVITGIVAVADCYDATTTLRAYQPQMQPMQAVEEIRSQGGTSLDGEIVRRFLELSGRFPVGSLVRLDSNEVGIVFTPSSDPRGAARVKVILDSAGRELAEPELLSLAQCGASIVGLVDPLLQGIDVSAYF